MSGFLDTSVIVRYFTDDPPEMGAIAAGIIDELDDLVVTPVILAEAAFALTRQYNQPREVVVDQLVALLENDNIDVRGLEKSIAIQALLLCRPSGRVSFADALLWAEARTANQPVFTFDERFPLNGIQILRAAT